MTNYRKICQEHNGYTDEEMRGMHVHHIDHDRNNNDPSNLLLVTPEEHAKLHPHMANFISKQHSAAVKGGKWHKGKPKSDEWKAKLSDRMMGNTLGDWERSEEYREFLSERLKGRTWVVEEFNLSEAGREERSNRMSLLNTKKAKCPHCGKKGQFANMKRWHYDRCNKR